MSTALAPIIEPMSEEMIRSSLLARVEVFNRSLDRVLRAFDTLQEVGNNLHKIFNGVLAADFSIGVYFEGSTHHFKYSDNVSDLLVKHYNRQAWRAALDEIQLWNVMGIEDSKKMRKQLDEGDLPEFTVENVLSTIMGLGAQAKNFAASAMREVFDFLTPRRSGLKTNSLFRVGKRAIIRCGVDKTYGGRFHVNYHRSDRLRAMDAAFHLLDGKGPMKEGRGPLIEAINAGNVTGETDYFRFKCFKNQNLHIEFKRLDLVKELNFIAAGERVLGHDQ